MSVPHGHRKDPPPESCLLTVDRTNRELKLGDTLEGKGGVIYLVRSYKGRCIVKVSPYTFLPNKFVQRYCIILNESK